MRTRVAWMGLLAGFLAGPAPSQSVHGCKGDLCPSVYHAHFEPNPGAAAGSGSRDGWESYPTTEETGYEPTIFPVTEGGTSRLVRDAAPTQDGPFSLGFIRRVNFVAGVGGSFHAELRAPLATGPQHVTLSIFHGRDEERHAAMLPDRGWHSFDIPLSHSDAVITAVALTTDLAQAHAGRGERFEMKDLRMEALAHRHLEVREPAALWDASRQLYYAQRTLRPGETLHVVLSPADPGLHWTLQSPDGRAVQRGEGIDVQHTFATGDSSGMWQLHAVGEHSSTDLLVLVRPERPAGLVFDTPPHLSPELLAAVRARRDELRAEAHPETGANIAKMDSHWLLAGLPSYFNILLQSPELAELDAIDYRASGDAAALTEARALLERIATWPLWVHPWFPAHGYHSYYPVGLMTRSVVMAMEFLGPDLAEADRAALEKALLEQSIRPIYEEYVLEDRLQFDTSNWIGNTVGGALLAALEGRDPQLGGYVLGLAIKERDHVRAAYTSDGSYGEGVTYHRFDLETTAPAAAAMKRCLGLSLDDDLLRGGESYMTHAAYGQAGALLDYGDSHVDIGPSNVFAYPASLNRSASLSDFYFRYRDPGTAELLPRVLWEAAIERPATASAPGPASKLFDRRGVVVLRDRWSADANVVAMRAGPNFNHNHADQGSVFYARDGILWLGEAGYADYYKDPSYNTYNIQALGHNVLLIDGNAESQSLPGNPIFGKFPAMDRSILGETAALVQADLTSVYRGKLDHYTRTLFWTADGSLAVLDDVHSAEPHRYAQVWHPMQPILHGDAHGVELAQGQDRLTLQGAGLGDIEVARRDAPLPLASYERAETQPIDRQQLILFRSKDAARSATLAAVIADGLSPEAPSLTAVGDATRLRFAGNSLVLDRSRGDAVVAHWSRGVVALNVRHLDEGLLGGSLDSQRGVDLLAEPISAIDVRLTVHGIVGDDLRLPGLRPTCRSGCTADSAGVHLDAPSAVMDLSAR